MSSNSVHLTDFPKVDHQSINAELSEKMKKVQTIVSLGLSRRARNKIRVRQPLKSITIGFQLEAHFNEIILDELNVKKIIIDEAITSKVKKICKPNARLIGPKYGKSVQEIITLGKDGKFSEQNDGTVKIDHRILQKDEYEFDYLKTDASLDIEATDGIVIAMDPEITPELEAEGLARDLVRAIQEARKEADYDIADRIHLSVQSGSLKIEEQFSQYIQEETLSTIVFDLPNPDLQKEMDLGNQVIQFSLKR